MKRQYQSFDYLLVIAVCALAIFGIVVIGSATHILTNGPSPEYTQQKIWFALGLLLMLMAAFIDYHFICKFYIPIYIFNIILLVILVVIGILTKDVVRWLRFGTLGIQPSEFSKVFMIIFLAKMITKYYNDINRLPVLLLLTGSVILPVILIMKQPSLSASLVSIAIFVVMLFIANLNYRYIFAALALIIPSSILFYIDLHRAEPILIHKIFNKYQLERVYDFFNSDPNGAIGYQQNQSIQAIGSGQLNGKGLYKGVVNGLSHLPESHNDFIFAVVGEELGFIGCVIILALLFFIIIKCCIIAKNATDNLGKLIATGVAGMLAFQTFVNVGVVTGLLPNTGMPLPLVSYGGSSMWITMIAIGLVINVGMSKSKSIFEG